jgi:hypothetical protein
MGVCADVSCYALPVSSESVLIFMLIVQGTAIHTGPCDDGLCLPQQIQDCTDTF